MNGPEHYAEAERLLARAHENIADALDRNDEAALDDALNAQDHAARVAQVHATLAHAAATVYAVPGSTPFWDEVTS